MKKICLILSALLLTPLLLTGCGGAPTSAVKVESDSLYVKKVDNLPEDFILGMDVSSVVAQERSGVKYYDFAGQEQDLLKILADSGITHIRVRVWNHPYDAQGRGFGGGNCDIGTAEEIGKRATQYGMKLIVDFHYSDFWADPGKQMVPLEWKDLDINAKSRALYEYTRDCLRQLKDANVDVGMVQVGNETNGALCGETSWDNILRLMQSGSKAIREVYPEALVAVHFANPERAGAYMDYAKRLKELDYDVFASSYYPFWHGTLSNLARVLSDVGRVYEKKTMVMETSYAYTAADSDFNGNTISDGGGITKNYPFTVQGQANSVRDVIDTVAQLDSGIGVVYWEGAWITVGTESWEKNHQLWEEFGSGWASSYAAVYDPDDAGKYFGGSAVDNQALFGLDGHPLESLKVFGLVRSGNEVETVPDAIEDTFLTAGLADPIELPETVNAVMTDGSLRPIPVTWAFDGDMEEQMRASGTADYDITGTAEGLPALCRISMVASNFLVNPDFETGDLTGWKLTELGSAEQLYVEDKLSDSLDGTRHMHFWSPDENSVEFTLEQTIQDLAPDTYVFAISIMGGDCGETEIYAYAGLDGEIVAKVPMTVTSYGYWDTGEIRDLAVGQGQTLTVGIYVKCQGEKNGAWGKIDGARLNTQS
ncbi:MAG: glycosyl hydrolase 53 family protein [Oscillospiraceae bacterium]|nr:glycosyl hydrolase 53 family protein [Oscillospiraceae bacterium]